MPVTSSAPATPPQDLAHIVLNVVAEKTGYPRDILGLDMDLEADLGIDSIKRVEILSAVAEARPDLPAVDTPTLGSLRTLGAILAHLGGEAASATDETGPVTRKPASTEAAMKIARRGVREVPAETVEQTEMPGLAAARKIAVIDDGGDIGSLVADRLRTHGVSSEIALHVPPDADGVVVIDCARRSGDDKALNSARQAFTAAQAFAATAAKQGGIFVTVQDSGGDFGLSGSSNGNAWMAGAPGLIKTLAQEWPHAKLRAIDLERDGRAPAELADRLVEELMSGGHREVGLRADGRRTTLEEFDLAPIGAFAPSLLGENPVLVVSGGARGVTAACIIALAGVTRLRLALIGRTPLEPEPLGFDGFTDEASLNSALLADARTRREAVTPRQLVERSARIMAGREIRNTLDRLTGLGSEAFYACADVADAAAVARAVSAARTRWGRIDGLVHGAGTLADKRVEDKSVEQFERVFTTKVLGLRALLAATEDDELRLICLFSSVAARYGNIGQADYAIANEVLNKVARAEAVRRGPGCHVRSLNWGPWDGGMVTPALREQFARRGIPVIKLEDGAAAFVEEVCRQGGNLSHVDVVLGSSLVQ
jgi:NAD(P)-dependent dehydrogenase (short-subunit alcohol dehydrogenase family)